jgi:hypothetical protein
LKEGLRNVFGPHDGRIWYCLDYSQLQLRIFAYLTEEKSMIEAFDNGYDFHGFIASKIFSKDIDKVTKLERRIGKNVNFGLSLGHRRGRSNRRQAFQDSGILSVKCFLLPIHSCDLSRDRFTTMGTLQHRMAIVSTAINHIKA